MKKHSIISLITFAILLTATQTLFAAGGNMGGPTQDGSPDYPYLIEDFDDFQVFCDDPNYWAIGTNTKLTCNLDLDPNLPNRKTYETAPIAPDTNNIDSFLQGSSFTGVFDGNAHIISNLNIYTDTANDYLGLFGQIKDETALVKNLGIENVNIIGGYDSRYIGGLCGRNHRATITNCYATGTIASGTNSDCIGGICGYNYGTINNCYATCTVTGHSYLGGITGCNYESTLNNCYAIGTVEGNSKFAVLCGSDNNGTITNCYFYLFSGPDNDLGTVLDSVQIFDANSFVGFDFAGNPDDGDNDDWAIVTDHCPKLSWQTTDGPQPPNQPITTLSGRGSAHAPFQINSIADFNEFSTNNTLTYGHYTLNTDIDMTGETFTTAVINRDFCGHFDGNKHVIRNVNIDTQGQHDDDLGLFNTITTSVRDLGIENINITGATRSYYLGGLCVTNSGEITNCYATGTITGGGYLAGLCVENISGTISNCYAECTINGESLLQTLGGLCGSTSSGTITNCYASGNINTGDYSWYVGGLCGKSTFSTITNCYSTSEINPGNNSSYVGGLCGNEFAGEITNSFWDVNSSGIGNEGDDNFGATGKTTIQMQTEATFTSATWSFFPDQGYTADWFMPTESYPKLLWQYNPANLEDFALLMQYWDMNHCYRGQPCNLVDWYDDDVIDMKDLNQLAINWLNDTAISNND